MTYRLLQHYWKRDCLSRQAIYRAIYLGRLKAKKIGRHWYALEKDYEEYVRTKYSRDYSTFEGKKVYDNFLGRYSINEAAAFLYLDRAKFYYHIYKGDIPVKFFGSFRYIDIEDLRNFSLKYLKKRKS